jgi:SAM-dependent methyltransferase
LKALARRIARFAVPLIPRVVWRGLFFMVAQQSPPRALRDLLEIEAELATRLNEASARYDGGVHVKHRLMRYHDFFVERVQPDDRVLDIGCGVGAVAASIAQRAGAQVVGIDLSATSINEGRQRYRMANLQLMHGDALVDLDSQAFDVVVLSNVLEHIEDRVGFLRAVAKRFQPRRWLMRVPMIDRDWRVPLRQELGLFAYSDPTHFTEYTRASFEAELAAAGLTICHLQVNWGEIWADAA